MKKFRIKHECEYMTGNIKGSAISVVEAGTKEEALAKYKSFPRRRVEGFEFKDIDVEDFDVADYCEPEIEEIKGENEND